MYLFVHPLMSSPSHMKILQLCLEARIWNNSSISWDSFHYSIHPLLPGLPVVSDVYFVDGI